MSQEELTFDQLIEHLNNAKENPRDVSWQIYRYLKAHFKEDGSITSRKLLMAYLQICPKEPGRLHSCMLQLACQMCQEFADFRFDGFLKLWGYPQYLTKEDHEQQTDDNGRKYLSLRQRVDRLLLSYMLHHTEARTDENRALIDTQEPAMIQPLMAIKIFESEVPSSRPGGTPRKMKSVKLIGTQGTEILADSHALPVKPWEIQGSMFDAIIRMSKEGKPRVQEAVLSQSRVNEVFPTVVGYVEHFDAAHNHYHVFDGQSRHFVAENPRVKPQVGDFVEFSPIIPIADRFKSAIIHTKLPGTPSSQHAEYAQYAAANGVKNGPESFGLLSAVIKFVNKEKAYFCYQLTDEPPTTPEGVVEKEGFANLALLDTYHLGDNASQQVRLLLFLKRGKDGKKHNYVARVYFP